MFDTKAATAREQFAALDLCDAADDISYLPFIVARAFCKTLMGDFNINHMSMVILYPLKRYTVIRFQSMYLSTSLKSTRCDMTFTAAN